MTVDYCSNCDNEAVKRITITPKLKDGNDKATMLLLCCQCDDAFQWGLSHGQDGDTVEEEEIETVMCSVCENSAPENTAHYHQEQWIGECCWDE